MAKAINHIERNESNVTEERTEDLQAILKQIADNREAIQESLTIIEELHNAGVLPIIRGLLRTREKVGALAIEQINQPGMHNIIKNGMSSLELLSAVTPDQLTKLADGLTRGVEKASKSVDADDQTGVWGLLKATKDPNVRTSLNTMIHFLEGMGEGLTDRQTH